MDATLPKSTPTFGHPSRLGKGVYHNASQLLDFLLSAFPYASWSDGTKCQGRFKFDLDCDTDGHKNKGRHRCLPSKNRQA
jgi:hypothetical protein